MKLIYALMATLITASMFACGGGGSGSIVLGPQEIPTEYADLSMGDLENRSSDITHKELIGSTKQGVYKGGNNPEIIENVMNHEGTLRHMRIFLLQNNVRTHEGTFTFWFCSLEREGATFSSRAGTDVRADVCVDPLFLLYNLDRGPELSKGDVIEFAGVVVGTQKKQGSRIEGIETYALFINPSVSVIKAELIDKE